MATLPRHKAGPVTTYYRKVEKSWSQADLAAELNRAEGVTTWTAKKVSNLETGAIKVDMDLALLLSDVLGASLDQLAHGLTGRERKGAAADTAR